MPQPPPLKAHLLGPARLAVGDRVLSDSLWPRRAARSLLLLLLATPGHRLPRERVVDLLWPDSTPDAARHTYYQALRTLCRVLEPGLPPRHPSAYVEAGAEMVGLHPHVDQWIDVDAFEAALAHAESILSTERRVGLRSALALYQGDLLRDELGAGWATARRETLHLAWQRTILTLADLDRAAGEPLATIASLEMVLAADETVEAAHRALMRAYAVAGEPDRAVRQYQRCRQALRAELDVEPSAETTSLLASLPAPAASASRHHNIPTPPNPLIGRNREIDAIQELLWQAEIRLVTLTGPGDVGKTRLALDVADAMADDFAGGVCFIPLAPVREPALVIPTIAQRLGLRDGGNQPLVERLRDYLRDEAILLLLDNVEQVVSAAGVIADLLASCPKVKMLVTSRLPLRLSAEHEYEVRPLAAPAAGSRASFAAIARSDAVTLFVQRAQAVQADFALTEQNAPVLAEICRHLDGLPLAIELAAARTKVLPPAALLARLDQRLTILTGGPRDQPTRLQTMRAAIAWSYDLLTPAEQTLFRRLAVFSGGFSLAAAEQVMGDREWVMGDGASPSPITHHPSPITLDGLAALLDHSLMRRLTNDGDEPRYGMLETIRVFGLERLTAAGEAEATGARHAAYLLALVGDGNPDGSPRIHDLPWLDTLDSDRDNLRAALRWAADHADGSTLLRLLNTSWWFWRNRGPLSEGRAWFERAMAITAADERVREPRLWATLLSADLAMVQGDFPRAVAGGLSVLAQWRRQADNGRRFRAWFLLGLVLVGRHQDHRACLVLSRVAAHFRETAEADWLANSLAMLAVLALRAPDLPRGAALLDESLRICQSSGFRWGMADVYEGLGVVARAQGDLATSTERYRQSLRIYQEFGDLWGVAGMMEQLGINAARQGDHTAAARHFGAAERLRLEAGLRPASTAAHHEERIAAMSAARGELGDADFAAAWRAGQSMPRDLIVATALMSAQSRPDVAS
ncbi:MAG: ATP-binding protein [Thermomicrobiales bacterium]